MHALGRAAAALLRCAVLATTVLATTVLGTTVLAATVLAATVLVGIGAPPALAAGNGGGGQCTVDLGGQWITVQCGSGSGSGGGGGSGGSGGGGGSTVTTVCTFTVLTQAEVQALGLPWPAPKGYEWAMLTCPGGQVQAAAQLINIATGAPQVTPQELLQQALSELHVPTLRPGTAPPLGTEGLVGLPEWFWIPVTDWQPLSVTVSAGPVWATATATPAGLSFLPGAGLGAVSCAGPGTAYDPRKSAQQQRSACEYTYDQSSDGQPGNSYQAAIAISWRVAWTGSGGAGGLIDAGLDIPFPFALRIAQGEALVSNP